MDEFINTDLSSVRDEKSSQTIKITSNVTPSIEFESSNDFVGNTMNIYLKKHKLDLTLLPNKKMIKLSDLTSTFSAMNRSPDTPSKNETIFSLKSITQETIIQSETGSSSNMINDSVEHSEDDLDDYEEKELNDDYEDGFEEDDDESDEETNQNKNKTSGNNSPYESSSNSIQTFNSSSNENTNKENSKITSRKKREPSLKLQQRLSNEDLELIVNYVRNRQASIYIADVKKDNYVDKILKVKLLNKTNDDHAKIFLSNGKNEALLKKSMFPKDLNTLFETFINSLCGQEQIIDENGIVKPTLTCLVVDCGFKSFSEAEIMRHIKRHLAQDGYTCPTCSHQFASMTNLQRHLRIHTGEIGKEVKCSQCDYRASTITHVKRHMAHKHLERALPCPHCSFMGATNAELKIHMARKHLELTGKNPLFLPKYLRKDYQCNICKEQYNDFKEYQTHMYEHTSSSNRFQCTECPYNCKNYSKLKRHMLYHSGARNYSCELCGNKFFQMEHLKRHMQSIHNMMTASSQSTTSNKTTKTKRKNQSHLNDEKSAQNSTAQLDQGYKVTSRCMYKCQQCGFSTVKIYDFNEHIIMKHYTPNNNISQLISQEIHFEDYDSEVDESQDEEENDDLSIVDDIINELSSNHSELFTCSFCSFKSDKKHNLKFHLQNNHSSQASAPILLSDDSVLVNPNTKFKCGTCKIFLNNINEYIKHMNETHKIQVFLLDAPCDSNPVNIIEKPEILNASALAQTIETFPGKSNKNQTKKSVVKKQIKEKSSMRRPPSRLQTNSNSLDNNNKQNMTVRINPLIFKQQQNSQPFQINFTKQKQQIKKQAFEIMTNMNNSNQILLNENVSEIGTDQFGFSQANNFLNHDTHVNNDILDTNNLNLIDQFQERS